MRDISKFEQQYNEETREMYGRYLENARKSVMPSDIPEQTIEFYEYMRFQQQHIYGQYDTEAWNHAGGEKIACETRDKRYMNTTYLCALFATAVAMICLFMDEILSVMYCVLLIFIFARSIVDTGRKILSEKLKKEDDLKMAATYQAMYELLERQLEMK